MITQESELVAQIGSDVRKVAVIVPLHNYQKHVEETLESVLKQTFRDILLVVVDDCSADNSLAVVERWMSRRSATDISVRLYHNVENARLSITRNTGIAKAPHSPYCFFLDADNVIYPRCIEKHVAALDSRPAAVAAHSIIEQFEGETGLIGVNVHDRKRLRRGNYIDAMAMIRRDALLGLGGYRNIRHGWEDFDVWLRFCDTEDLIVHIPEILSRYRVHSASMLRTQTNMDRNIRELRKTISKLHPWLEL